jgi:lysophospholipase L1-like esterase
MEGSLKTYRALATLTLVILAVGSAFPAFSQPGAPAEASEISQARSLTVAQDGEGQLWAVWEADNGWDVDLYYSRWTGDDWSSPRPVHRRSNAWDRSPSLTVDVDGTPWLVWSSAESISPDRNSLYVSRWAGHDWTDPELVPTGSSSEATEPVLVAGAADTLWLAWVGFDGTDDEIFASYWDGRSWSAPQQVSVDDDKPSLYDRQPRLAVGPDGRPWLVWTGHQAGVDDEIYASHWTGSAWTAEQAISNDDDALDVSPSLTLDRHNQPWVAWQGRVDSHLRILVSHWDASRSAWTAEAVASSPLASEVAEDLPVLSSGARGRIYLAWVATSGADSALAYARWQGGQWTDASLIRSGATIGAAAWTSTKDDEANLVWLNPAPDGRSSLGWAPTEDTSRPLSAWIEQQAASEQKPNVDPIPNLYLAYGDSITFGGWTTPYPQQLEENLLDIRVADSVVVNSGNPGEGTLGGSERIGGQVTTHQPQYVLIMEGTNDVSDGKLPSIVKDNLKNMIDNAINAGVDNVQVMLATLIPRTDDLLDETDEMNELAVIPAAAERGVPLCDQWWAFVSRADWRLLFWTGDPEDPYHKVHPNINGMWLMAQTFYDCLLASYPELEEETTPPVTWIEYNPASAECGDTVRVTWAGEDNLSRVVDYDVQVKVNEEPWADWMTGTVYTFGIYVPANSRYGDRLYFRVRGRDVVGNQGEYSEAAYTDIADSVPPYEAHVEPLPPIQLAPFPASWWGADACADVVAYRARYGVGSPGSWEDWPGHPTPNTSDAFSPTTPFYGESYYFQVQVQDAAGNWSDWSEDEVSTVLARFSLGGHTYNIRHQPVAAAQVVITPDPQWFSLQPASFVAYSTTGGDYSITVSRTVRYGPLPTMLDVPLDQDVNDLEFILPPQDDAIADGDLEAPDLSAWQTGGTTAPTLTDVAYTGGGGVRLDGSLGSSLLNQVITPAPGISDPTLSFLARLADDGPPSTLQIELANSGTLSLPVTYTLPVEDTGWTHAWYELDGRDSEPLTLTFTVSGNPAVILDEIRLGSAVAGGSWLYVPLIYRE